MNTVPLWITLLGFAAPLLALAGSAVAYIVKIFLDSHEKRRIRFFDLMKYIDGKDAISAKVAAIYELRDFPEHKEFIIRFCRTQRENIIGGGAQPLIEEMDATRSFLEKLP